VAIAKEVAGEEATVIEVVEVVEEVSA